MCVFVDSSIGLVLGYNKQPASIVNLCVAVFSFCVRAFFMIVYDCTWLTCDWIWLYMIFRVMYAYLRSHTYEYYYLCLYMIGFFDICIIVYGYTT